MTLQWIDWLSVILFFVLSLIIGLAVSRRAGSSSGEYFASGRSMPWWLLGVSMVATTFSADTPNLVTDMVRQNGVSGNWLWWAFLLTGLVTVFVYARLWRRSSVLTDIEFYELRYSGRSAAFLRGFRALYLGIFFNVMIMATVSLAAIKIGGVMLGLSPLQVILLSSVIVVCYTMLGGLTGVLITDLFQFVIAMFGALAAAVTAVQLPQIGSLQNLFAKVPGKLSLLPDFNDPAQLWALLIIPLAVQWWSVWYPGAEPGGGGYIAQRMLAARNENHAAGATLFFNIAHYALRPWPWIIVALASLVIFPDLASLQRAFPHIDPAIVHHDLAYPAMLTFLPAGLLGLVVASLIAAFMSTISTHLNWGSSYIVNDFYKRFVNPRADEKNLVRVGRLSTLLLMAAAALVALLLENALQSFNILLQIGAGTGLLFLLRWFWWRINAGGEIAAMVISFLAAVFFELIYPRLGLPPIGSSSKLVIGVAVTTVGWLTVTFLTRPTDQKTLVRFYRLIRPGGPGWKKVLEREATEHPAESLPPAQWNLPRAILAVFFGLLFIWGSLFATGYWLYGRSLPALTATLTALVGGFGLILSWKRLNPEEKRT